MALMQVRFFSAALGKQAEFQAIVPQSMDAAKQFKVLYLLHGLSDDSSMWTRFTAIERYAASYPLIVIMPDAERSYYTDMKEGARFWTMISEELPQVVKGFFHVSERREDTVAAGLSMGGYGALKLALRCPERFGAVAAFSSAVDPGMLMLEPARATLEPEFRRIFGSLEELHGSGNDLFHVANTLRRQEAPLPRVRQYCGAEDFLIAPNRAFRAHLEALAWPDYRYIETPGKAHTWDYWDWCINDALPFLMA